MSNIFSITLCFVFWVLLFATMPWWIIITLYICALTLVAVNAVVGTW